MLSAQTTCGGTLTPNAAVIQEFASPGFPGGYAPNEHCEWIIAGTRDKHQIVLRTNNFETDESEGCKLDHVVIYEGGTKLITTFFFLTEKPVMPKFTIEEPVWGKIG